MEEVDVKVKVEVQEAEQNLDKLIDKADEAKESIENINKATKDSVPTVGNLDKAWESALDNITEGLGSTGTSIKKIVSGVRGAIPVLKNLNNTAISGLKGIKAAIASTGLGVIVLILGEVLAHWQDIAKWIGIGTKAQNEYTTAVERSESAVKDLNWQHEREIALLQAAGASKVEIAEATARQARENIELVNQQYRENMALATTKKARKQITEEYNKQYKAAKDEFDLAVKRRDLAKETEKIQKEAEERRKREQEEERRRTGSSRVSSTTIDYTSVLSKSIEDFKKYEDDVYKIMLEISENRDKLFSEKSQEWFTNLLLPQTPIKDSKEVVEEIQKAYKSYNEAIDKQISDLQTKRADLVKENKDVNEAVIKGIDKDIQSLKNSKVTLTYEAYLGLLTGDAKKAALELNELNSERNLLLVTGRATLAENLQKEYDIQERAFANEELLLNRRKKFLEDNKIQGPEYQEVISQLAVLSDNRIAFERTQSRKIAEAVREGEEEILKAREDVLNTESGSMDMFGETKAKVKEAKDIYDARLRSLADYYARMRDTYDEGTTEYEHYAKLYEETLKKLNGADKERTRIVTEQLYLQFQKYDQFTNYLSSLVSSMSDIWEESLNARKADIDEQLRQQKISEEIAEEQYEQLDASYERMKVLRYTEVILNTISGAIGAFLQASSTYPPPYGQILGAATAASVTAAGMAEAAKIRNTHFGAAGNTSGVGGISAPSVGVTPIDVRDDIQQSPTVLANSQSPTELQVFILQGDLEDSHKQVQIREENTTF